jgi:hypothetical protein
MCSLELVGHYNADRNHLGSWQLVNIDRMLDLHRGRRAGIDLDSGREGTDALDSNVAEMTVLQSPPVGECPATYWDTNDNHRVSAVSVRYGKLTAKVEYLLLAVLSRTPSRKWPLNKHQLPAPPADKGSEGPDRVDYWSSKFKPENAINWHYYAPQLPTSLSSE